MDARTWRRGARAALLAGTLSAVLFLAPRPALAFNEEAVLECVLAQTLALLTCKEPEAFSFIGARDGVYVYNAHYGAKYTEFYVQQTGDLFIFTSKAWKGDMGSARMVHDYTNGCISASIPPEPCSTIKHPKCCGN